jgi:hypothetical protein
MTEPVTRLQAALADLAATLGPDRFAREIEVAARLRHPHTRTAPPGRPRDRGVC